MQPEVCNPYVVWCKWHCKLIRKSDTIAISRTYNQCQWGNTATDNFPLGNTSTLSTKSGLRTWAGQWLTSSSLRLLITVPALIAVSVALVLVGRSLSPVAIWRSLRAASPHWLELAAGLLVAGQALRVWRTVRVLSWEARARPINVAQGLAGGQVINWLSPVRVGDVWRVLHLAQGGQNSLTWIASDTLLEKGADSIVLALFAAALVLLPLPDGFTVPVTRFAGSIIACLMAFSAISTLSSARLRDKLLARLPKHAAFDRWRQMSLPDLKVRHRPGDWLELAVTSVLIWVSGLAVNMAVAKAFGIKIDLATHLLFLLMLQTTTVLAPVPGNIGVFPLVALTVLGAVGIDRSLAAAFGGLLYVLVYMVLFVIAAVAFLPVLFHALAPAPTYVRRR